MTVLLAPDSFKGSLTSLEVAAAFASGWGRARPQDEIVLAPLADGGEGTLAAIAAGGGWEWRRAAAHDPIGRPIEASWLCSADGERAVVELASASGLSRLAADELDPIGATTFGTGEVLRNVLDAGVRTVTLGIGGSATNDGGWGLIRALGGSTPPPIEPRRAARPSAVDLAALDPRLATLSISIACDVTNPLLGLAGAAAVYGPQKGATPADVRLLDAELAAYAAALERATGRRERDTPGAGAAGGTGFGLLCLRDRVRSLTLRPGVDLVMEAIGFDERLARVDLVVTGEGSIDAQTAFGKTALGVARRARESGVACIAIGGGIDAAGSAALAELGVVAIPLVERPEPLERAMAAGPEPVERAGERIGHLISLGGALTATGG